MKKEKTKARELESLKQDALELIPTLNNKYNEYLGYLPKNFIEKVISEKITSYNKETGTSPEIQLELEVEKSISSYLSNLVNHGNIELEIALIDKYYKTANIVLRKMEMQYQVTQNELEDMILDGIKSYDGQTISLDLHVVRVVKEKLKSENKKLVRK